MCIRAVAVLLLLSSICTLAACNDPNDYPQRLDAVSSNSAQNAAATGFEGSFAAPPLRAGSYIMTTSQVSQVDYSIGSTSYLTITDEMQYHYALDVKKLDNGYSAKFTFDRAVYTQSRSGEVIYEFDTDDVSTRTEDVLAYFSLIGQSFTCKFDSDLNFKSISGVDKIHKAYPETAELTAESDLADLASEVIFALPEKIEYGSSFKTTQELAGGSTITQTFTADKMRGERIGFKVGSDDEIALPADESSDGYYAHYTGASQFTGALWVSTNDRLDFESTRTIKYYSDVTTDADDGTQTVFDCEFAFSSTTRVSPA